MATLNKKHKYSYVFSQVSNNECYGTIKSSLHYWTINKYWPCVMTAHMMSIKNPKHSIFCFVEESCKKVCLLERGVYWRGGLCFQLWLIWGGEFIGEGHNWDGGLRELLRYVSC